MPFTPKSLDRCVVGFVKRQGHLAFAEALHGSFDQMLGYLKDHPWEAASILWTLEADLTPIYGIAPAGPFAARAYDFLREFLEDRVSARVELVSIPGRLTGQARLTSLSPRR